MLRLCRCSFKAVYPIVISYSSTPINNNDTRGMVNNDQGRRYLVFDVVFGRTFCSSFVSEMLITLHDPVPVANCRRKAITVRTAINQANPSHCEFLTNGCNQLKRVPDKIPPQHRVRTRGSADREKDPRLNRGASSVVLPGIVIIPRGTRNSREPMLIEGSFSDVWGARFLLFGMTRRTNSGGGNPYYIMR